jgi:serine/threonine protein kinase
MPLVPGSRLDNYEIIRLLGAGGMGEVWLARDVRLERNVALKLLPADVTTDQTRVKRFEQEARAASGLNHPNVCTIHALGHAADGRHFIAMEYVEGGTLRERRSVSNRQCRTAPITAPTAAPMPAPIPPTNRPPAIRALSGYV